MKSYVYVITHAESGRHYVGKTNYPYRRWKHHQWLALTCTNATKKCAIHHAIAKYGPAAFAYQVIEEWPDEASAYESEAFWVEFLQSWRIGYGFNETRGGMGLPSGSLHPLYGRKRDASVGAKIASRLRGRKLSPEHIAAAVEGRRGYSPSEETRRKKSLVMTGKRHSEATKKRLREMNSGKTLATETIEKIRAVHLGRKNSPETIEKMHAAHKARIAAMTDSERAAKFGGKRKAGTGNNIAAGYKAFLAAMTEQERADYYAKRAETRKANAEAKKAALPAIADGTERAA